MKKLLLLFMAFIMIFLCACGSTATNTDTPENSITPGEKTAIRGIGTATFEKIYTTHKIMPTVKSGCYIKPQNTDTCYIDTVFRITTGKTTVNSDEIGSIYAKGVQSGEEYTQYLCAVESSDNRNVSANVQIGENQEATLHMALLIPADPVDMDYDVTITLGKTQYNIRYTLNEYMDCSEEIISGESFSGDIVNVLYKQSEYNFKLYDDAPDVSNSDVDYVYLTSAFEITNKSLNTEAIDSLLSVCAIYGSECYNARYLVEDKNNRYVATNSIDPLETKNVIAVIDLPVAYSELSAKIIMATDYKEYSHTVDGTDDIIKKREERKKYLEEMQKIKEQEEQKRLEEEKKKAELEQQNKQNETDTEQNKDTAQNTQDTQNTQNTQADSSAD